MQDDWELLTSDEVRSRSNSDLLASPDHGAKEAVTNVENGAKGCVNSAKDTNGTKVNNEQQVNNVATSGSNISGSDFFSKYDSSIAALKSKVEKMEKSSR